jgi:hypothetical protein
MIVKIDNGRRHPLRDREIIENFSEFLVMILAGGAKPSLPFYQFKHQWPGSFEGKLRENSSVND